MLANLNQPGGTKFAGLASSPQQILNWRKKKDMKKNLLYLAVLLAALSLLAAACAPAQPESTPEGVVEKTIYVGPELVDCVGVGPQQCMQVREDPDAPYTNFYDRIEGFEFEPGYEYVLLVRVEPVENPPADASSLRYILVEEVSRTPVESAEAPALEGTEWLLSELQGSDGGLQAALPDRNVTALFDGERVGGSSGCNQYGGSYTLDGESLSIGPLMSTLMACPEPGVMEQEAAFTGLMSETASYQVEGQELRLLDADGQVLLVFQAQEAVELEGSNWEATMVNNGKEAVVSLVAGTSITASFGADGRVAGSAGCNQYTAGFTAADGTIEIGPPVSTRMACGEPQGVMEQETAYLQALEKATSYTIRDGVLELRDANGALQVSYRQAAQ